MWFKSVCKHPIIKSHIAGSVYIAPGEIFFGPAAHITGGSVSGRYERVDLKAIALRAREIVVVRKTMLGDVLVAVAALRAIARHYNLKATLLTSPRYTELLMEVGDVNFGYAPTTLPKIKDDGAAIVMSWERVFECDRQIHNKSRLNIVLEPFGLIG